MKINNRTALALAVLLIVLTAVLPLYAADGIGYISPAYGSDGTEEFGLQSFLEQNRYTEESFARISALTQAEMVAFAQNAASYRLTPGDSFRLGYSYGRETVTGVYQVDFSYKVTIPEIGTFDCWDKSFSQLVEEVGQSIAFSMQFASPAMEMVYCGTFAVPVTGEVRSMVPVTGWGGCTLSAAIGNASRFASSRNVIIRHADGTATEYDIYDGLKSNNPADNPVLRPGDSVEFVRAERLVVLSGAVYNPGTYQVLAGQTVGDLINTYGGGLLPTANPDSVTVIRFADGKDTGLAADMNTELVNLDRVSVFASTVKTGKVTVEGALAPSQAAGESVTVSASKLIYSFYPGEKVSDLLKAVSGAFVPQSDLGGIYMVRGSEIISLESAQLLSGLPAEDPVLQAEDKLIVPFTSTYVTVNGAVNNPGRVAYAPGQAASYYIGLSGGYSSSAKGGGGLYTVVDSNGNSLDTDDVIPNGAIITVKSKTLTQDIALAASIVSLTLNVLYVIAQFIGLFGSGN